MLIAEVAMEIAYHHGFLQKIAEKYNAEAARACGMSSSVGGIGPLLKERIESQAELGADVIGISLLYNSVWVQGVHQWGQIFIEKKNVGAYLRSVLEDANIKFNLTLPDGSQTEVKVWKTMLGKGTVYLLDAPDVASVVYPGPEDAPPDNANAHEWAERQKLNQSWLVGRGSLALLKELNRRPDFLLQSETPTFFANHFLIDDAFRTDPFFHGIKYIFNDHTPLEYAHPVWNEAQVAKAKIHEEFARHKNYWNAQTKSIDVTRLLIGVSTYTFGVSKKHGVVMRSMPSLKGMEDKISTITNGIAVKDWQHPDYRGWDKLTDEQLIALKEKKKNELIDWAWKRYRLWVNWRGKVRGKCFALWTRRVTSYKRFDVLHSLLKDPAMKKRLLATDVVVLVGGRLHQNDNLSQNVVFSLLDLVTHDKELADRVLVIDNYNIWDAPKLFSGVDATIMLADDGREASATGFMKAQVNGAAVIGCQDGAVPESVTFWKEGEPEANGFNVPYVNGQPQPEGLLNAFEQMNRVYHDLPARARLVRASFKAETFVNVDRTAGEMIRLYQSLQK